MSQKTKDATTHAHNHCRIDNIIMSFDIMAVATVLISNALTIHFLYTVAYSCFHLDTTYRTLGSRVTFSLLNRYLPLVHKILLWYMNKYSIYLDETFKKKVFGTECTIIGTLRTPISVQNCVYKIFFTSTFCTTNLNRIKRFS